MSSTTPLLYETHSHTPLCKHAQGTPAEYAAAAERRGLKGIIFTCHCPLPDGISINARMSPEEFPTYVDWIRRTREEFAGRVDVRLGLESDFYPGVEPWLRELHAREPLNYVLGSVHPQMTHYRARYFTGDFYAYQRLYFDHLAQAAESGLFDCLAHPDLVKNESPAEWNFSRIEPDIARALDRIAATGMAIELNTSGVNKALPELNPGLAIVRMAHARGIPFVVGADAHRPTRVADGFEHALALLRDAGYSDVHYFLERRRHAVRIDDALRTLRPVAA